MNFTNITIPTDLYLDNILMEVNYYQDYVITVFRTPIIATVVLLHIALLLFVFRKRIALKFGNHQQHAYNIIGSIVMWSLIVSIMVLLSLLFIQFEGMSTLVS